MGHGRRTLLSLMPNDFETLETLGGEDETSLLEILDHVLNSGVVIHGSLVISLAGVDLGLSGAQRCAHVRGNGAEQSANRGEAEAEVSRILVYCGFRHAPGLDLPTLGVSGAPVQVAALDQLNLLWSEVEWPFDPERMQKSAVEFHEVVHQVFKQTAVIPFRLLSVFEDQAAFTSLCRRKS